MTIARASRHTGGADARNFQYIPAYILRGLTRLVLEFTLPPQAAG